jgi:hypothetical protein
VRAAGDCAGLSDPHPNLASDPALNTAPQGTRRGLRFGDRCRAQAVTRPMQDPSARRGCAAGRFGAPGPLDDRLWCSRRDGAGLADPHPNLASVPGLNTAPQSTRRGLHSGARCRARADTCPMQDPSARVGCAAGQFGALGPLDDRVWRFAELWVTNRTGSLPPRSLRGKGWGWGAPDACNHCPSNHPVPSETTYHSRPRPSTRSPSSAASSPHRAPVAR